MKRMFSGFPLSAFALAIMLALTIACASKPDDARISSDIQSKFSQDSGLSSKQLSVQSANGVVTLSGTVDNDAQRDAASRQAASVAGVKEVVNNLKVGTVAAAAPAAPPIPASASASSAPSSTATSAKPAAGKKSRRSHNSQMAANDSPSNNAARKIRAPTPPRRRLTILPLTYRLPPRQRNLRRHHPRPLPNSSSLTRERSSRYG